MRTRTGEEHPGRPVSARTLWGIFAIVLALILLDTAAEIVLLVYVGVLFAVGLRGGGRKLAGWTGFSPRVAMAVFLLALAGLAVGAVMLLTPHVKAQFADIAERLPQHVEELEDTLRQSALGRRALSALESSGDRIGMDTLGAVLGGARGVLSTTTSFLAGVLVVFFLGLFLSIQPRLYSDGALLLVPAERRERAREVLRALTQKLRGWVLAKLVSMGVIGVLTTIGLLILGVPLPFTLGLVTALLTFIPNVGPVLSVIPPVLLALTMSPTLVLAVIALYIGIQTLESWIVTPMVLRGTIRLPPALTIVSQVLMGYLFGILGLLTAAPTVVLIVVLFDQLYVEEPDYNGDGDRGA